MLLRHGLRISVISFTVKPLNMHGGSSGLRVSEVRLGYMLAKSFRSLQSVRSRTIHMVTPTRLDKLPRLADADLIWVFFNYTLSVQHLHACLNVVLRDRRALMMLFFIISNVVPLKTTMIICAHSSIGSLLLHGRSKMMFER